MCCNIRCAYTLKTIFYYLQKRKNNDLTLTCYLNKYLTDMFIIQFTTFEMIISFIKSFQNESRHDINKKNYGLN